MNKIEGIITKKSISDINIIIKGTILKENKNETNEIYCKNMYEKYKEDMFKYIKGEYVLVLQDNNKVILARDKIGHEQLYYTVQNGNLYYSTEFKFFLQNKSLKKKIRLDILQRFLTYSYIAAPDTILEDVYKIEPGNIIIYQKGKIKKLKYYDILSTYKKILREQENDFEKCKQNLKAELENIIKTRLEPNKIYGTYLSGGIDSTLITAISNKYATEPIRTFSIGFYDEEFNEAVYAKQISEYLKCKHNELYIDKKRILETIKKIPYIYDEPFADPSQIPTIILNEFAKQKGVYEILTGDGADQIFCGSTIYDAIEKKSDEEKSLKYMLRVQFDRYKREKRIRAKIINSKKTMIYNINNYRIKDERISRMILETKKFLPDRLLQKVSKASNANAIKLIKPFASESFIEQSYKIPLIYKYNNGEKKYILKEIVYDFVPKKYLDRPKHGFGIPLERWLLEEPLYSELIRVSNKERIDKQKIFDSKKINDFIEGFRTTKRKGDAIILWSFYIFQIWYETYIDKEY